MKSGQLIEQLVRLFPEQSKPDARVALAIYRMLAGDRTASPGLVAEAAGVSEAHVQTLLNTWPGVFRDEGGDVTGFWGLARPEMRHRITVNSRTRYAWCAWDTLFIPELLGHTADIVSRTALDEKPIRLHILRDVTQVEPVPTQPVYVSFVLPAEDGWETNVITTFCHHVHFLVGDEVQRWLDQDRANAVLTLDEAFDAGRRKNAFQFGNELTEFQMQSKAKGASSVEPAPACRV